MPIYSLYVAKDQSEATMFQSDGERTPEQERLLTHTVDDEPMILAAEFYAPNWGAAKKAQDALLYPEDGTPSVRDIS